jgi:predicted kinase
MESNNTVFLLVGPRGSGKSEYLKKIVGQQVGVSAVSRDEILIRLFGSVHSSPYTGELSVASMVLSRLLRRRLSTQTNLKLVLEYWTGGSRERQRLMTELRKQGASKVVALYFVTPVELVSEWFWKKPGIAKVSAMKNPQPEGTVFFSESAPFRDYELFHQFATEIDSDGFDEVIRINPLDPAIVL